MLLLLALAVLAVPFVLTRSLQQGPPPRTLNGPAAPVVTRTTPPVPDGVAAAGSPAEPTARAVPVMLLPAALPGVLSGSDPEGAAAPAGPPDLPARPAAVERATERVQTPRPVGATTPPRKPATTVTTGDKSQRSQTARAERAAPASPLAKAASGRPASSAKAAPAAATRSARGTTTKPPARSAGAPQERCPRASSVLAGCIPGA
jgi:hypothetical protein